MKILVLWLKPSGNTIHNTREMFVDGRLIELTAQNKLLITS